MSKLQGIAPEPLTIDQIKQKGAAFAELYEELDYGLSLAFALYYGEYYRKMNDDVVRPEDGMQTEFRLVSVDEEEAVFVVSGYTFYKEEINPNPTPAEDPDHDPDDYFLTAVTHTRERFVSMPLTYMEDPAPFMEEVAKKQENDLKAKRIALKEDIVRLKKSQKDIDRQIEQLKHELNDGKPVKSKKKAKKK